MATTSLQKAKSAKNDEFYTQLNDVNDELVHYKEQLAGKVVFCNCDDPYESNFFKYFAMNFNHLKLKKLTASSYKPSSIAGKQLPLFEIEGLKDLDEKEPFAIEINEVVDRDGNGAFNLIDVELLLKQEKNATWKLEGDNKYPAGDFRSKECVELLKQADVVVTNPPYSLFREYVAQLVEYKKEFVIVGNPNALHYKEIFRLIKDSKLWLGYKKTGVDMLFNVPDVFAQELLETKKEGSGYKIVNGKVLGRAPAVWFTNLDTTKRHEDIIGNLYKKYKPEDFPTYDNYDAIEVSKVMEIPEDYFGAMGVPDTFLEIYNPEQFEIIGIPFGNLGKEIGVTKNYRGRTDISITKDGKTKCPYSRIIIKRKELKNED